jgi:predicted cupin superfamily sugar epimerase
VANPTRARELIERLQMQPHPERGYFVETYRSANDVGCATHPGQRSASTAIYYLVTAEQPATALHRLLSDEIFHLYEGGPLAILRLFPDGSWDRPTLGLDLDAGQRPQIVIPAGTWFGAELDEGAEHCLVGCTVAPGFDFQDFELAQGPELAERYPQARKTIERMSR